ncbi:MAG: hypothetical protein ACREA9_03780 [Pyrinomonadaceae bacterium]
MNLLIAEIRAMERLKARAPYRLWILLSIVLGLAYGGLRFHREKTEKPAAADRTPSG